ncbi:hypothetical protein L1887_58367 [Cichorium endivia]|nr:hypothetical protein L1887_58367 [Cichorium endivia]
MARWRRDCYLLGDILAKGDGHGLPVACAANKAGRSARLVRVCASSGDHCGSGWELREMMGVDTQRCVAMWVGAVCRVEAVQESGRSTDSRQADDRGGGDNMDQWRCFLDGSFWGLRVAEWSGARRVAINVCCLAASRGCNVPFGKVG